MAGPATSPSAALCADVTALRTSVDSLTTVNLAPGITEELKSDLADVEARLSAVVSDARGRWQAETDAVVAALATLEAVVRTAAASPGTGGASNIRVAVEGLRASVQNLLTVVRPACPSVAPSLSG